jgi:hypothetical protein
MFNKVDVRRSVLILDVQESYNLVQESYSRCSRELQIIFVPAYFAFCVKLNKERYMTWGNIFCKLKEVNRAELMFFKLSNFLHIQMMIEQFKYWYVYSNPSYLTYMCYTVVQLHWSRRTHHLVRGGNSAYKKCTFLYMYHHRSVKYEQMCNLIGLRVLKFS